MGAAKMNGLKKLEYLSLVSKICTELESHIGCGDKVLAEFIADLGRTSRTVDEFDAKLKESGAEMLDYFVRTLLTIIHAILPPETDGQAGDKSGAAGTKKGAFPGLSVADDRERIRALEREIEGDAAAPGLEEDNYDRAKVRGRDREGRDRYREEGDERNSRRDRHREERDDDSYRERRREGRNRDRDFDDDRNHRDRRREESKSYGNGRDEDRYPERRSGRHRGSDRYRDIEEEEHSDKVRNSDEPELYAV